MPEEMQEHMQDERIKGRKVRNQINASMSDEDMEILERLKRIYGINTSAIIKLGIRKLLPDTEEETSYGKNVRRPHG
jgi:hydrogenase maturation factor